MLTLGTLGTKKKSKIFRRSAQKIKLLFSIYYLIKYRKLKIKNHLKSLAKKKLTYLPGWKIWNPTIR